MTNNSVMAGLDPAIQGNPITLSVVRLLWMAASEGGHHVVDSEVTDLSRGCTFPLPSPL
jgi:hypothetical protein